MSSQPEKKQWVGSVCFSSLYVCICLCVCVLRKYGLIGNPGQKIFRDSIFHHILHRIEYTLEPELMNVLSENVFAIVQALYRAGCIHLVLLGSCLFKRFSPLL